MKGARTLANVVSIAVLAIAPATSGQPDEPDDWYGLPYFQHGYGGWFRIWTNESTFDPGARVLGASSAFQPYPGPTAEEQQTEFQVLWADNCQKKKAQTFKTSRSIYLMGAPEKLMVSLGAYQYSSDGSNGPVDWVKLQVNGKVVYKITNAQSAIPFDSSQRAKVDISDAPLKVGLNTFTISGHKKKTKKSQGWCQGDKLIGILGEVYGEFLADVGVTDFGSFSGDAKGIGFDITATNNGPSELIPMAQLGYQTFGISAVSGNWKIAAMTVAGLSGCSSVTPTTIGGKQGLTAFCPMPRMEPGDSATVHIQVAWDPPYNTGATTDIYWTATGYGEDTAELQADNSKTVTLEIGEDVPSSP